MSEHVRRAARTYGAATRTGLADGRFDAVVCVFGVLFAPDMAAFVAEMWRLVGPGSRARCPMATPVP